MNNKITLPDWFENEILQEFDAEINAANILTPTSGRCEAVIDSFLGSNHQFMEEFEYEFYGISNASINNEIFKYRKIKNEQGCVIYEFNKGTQQSTNWAAFPRRYSNKYILSKIENAYTNGSQETPNSHGHECESKIGEIPVKIQIDSNRCVTDIWPIIGSLSQTRPNFSSAFTATARNHILNGEFSSGGISGGGKFIKIHSGMHTEHAYHDFLTKLKGIGSSSSDHIIQESWNNVIRIQMPSNCYNGNAKSGMGSAVKNNGLVQYCKTLFPKQWSDSEIVNAIESVYNSPELIVPLASQTTYHGTYKDVKLTLILSPAINGNVEIKSAFPSWEQDGSLAFLSRDLEGIRFEKASDIWYSKLWPIFSKRIRQRKHQITKSKIKRIVAGKFPDLTAKESESLVSAIHKYVKDVISNNHSPISFDGEDVIIIDLQEVFHCIHPFVWSIEKIRAGKIGLDSLYGKNVSILERRITRIEQQIIRFEKIRAADVIIDREKMLLRIQKVKLNAIKSKI